METRRNETAKGAKRSWSNSTLLVTVVMLTMIAAAGCASLFLLSPPVYSVTPSISVFDFDAGSPPPVLYQNTPFSYLSLGGVTAHFSSPSDVVLPAFSVQSTVPLGYNLSMFSGQWLYDNQQSRDYLDMQFNALLYSINLTFATVQPHGGPTEQPCYINLTAHMDSIGNQVGWTWARGVQSTLNTQGTLSFNSGGQPFNLVRIWIPFQPSAVPVTDFFVDNVAILATPVQDTTPPVTTINLSGTLGNQGWYKSDVTVSLSATDDLSGVNKIEYSYDNTVWNTYATPFTITTEGTTTVYYRAADNAGNVETAKSQTVKIDKVSPATTVSLSGTVGNGGWYRSDVTVTLSASDGVSGVAQTEYSYNGGTWTAYTTPFIITAEGTTTVYYRSTDNAGNVETASAQAVKVDKSSPTTTMSLSGVLGNAGWYKSTVTVTLTSTDQVSGLAETRFSFNNVDWTTYTAPFTVTADGTTTIFFRSTDNAGNIEAVKSQTVKVDKLPPTTAISLSGVIGNNGWYTSTVTVTLTASDGLSGVAATEYSSDGTTWMPYTVPFVVSNQGTNMVYYRSIDLAGNVELATTQTVKVDTSSPITTISLSGVPGDVTITLSATDSASGVSKIEYSFDNSQWTVYTTPFTVTDPATTILYYRSTDMAGNVETVKTKTLTGDNTPPATTISLSGVLGDQGWYTSNVEVSLSATDDWSGVAKTEFSFDNVDWTVYTTPFSLTTEGTTIVYYRSTDAIGNVEATLSQSVKIDKSSPTGSVVINGGDASTTSTSVTLTLTSNDAFSGVFKVRYSNDGMWDTEQWENPSTTKTWTLTSELGTKTVFYQIMDNAGLISATYQDTITLEAGPPPVDTTNPVAKAGPDQAATEDAVVTFDGSASADNVAITTYTWTFTDVTSRTLTGMKPTYTFSTPGIYTVTLKVTDAAGNSATDTVIIEVLDTTDPIANAGQDRTVDVGTAVSFDAGASSDNVGIVEYEWDCSDGTNHIGKTISHTFNATGTYIVTLRIRDAAGNEATDTINVTVVQPPLLSIPASQLWIFAAVIAIGLGATAVVLLRRRE